MLQELMEAIAGLENAHSEGPHDSSFCPRPDSYPNGMVPGPNSSPRDLNAQDTIQPTQSLRTSFSIKIKNTTLKRKSKKSPTQQANSTSPTPDTVKRDFTGFLPCYYFDYIIGTSTGG